MKKDEIAELALRYIEPSELADFPDEQDLFCTLARKTESEKILSDDEGWGFVSYGICTGYSMDLEAKPLGKWIWFNYISLSSFPPVAENIKLQPPLIAKGLYSSADRSVQFRIVKIGITSSKKPPATKKTAIKKKGDNLIQFPGAPQ